MQLSVGVHNLLNSAETVVHLGLGANMGDRESNLEEAISRLSRLPASRVLRRSKIYGSKAWGKTDQPDYLNMVVEISTKLPPQTLLRHCKHIETEMGRQEGERWGPRPIDVDILLYDNRKLRTASLTVPHLHLWERHFVLRPLSDLLPLLRRGDGKTIDQALAEAQISSQAVWLHREAGNGADEKEV